MSCRSLWVLIFLVPILVACGGRKSRLDGGPLDGIPTSDAAIDSLQSDSLQSDVMQSDVIPGCAPPKERCGDVCVDTTRDPLHCGACDSPCAPPKLCIQGACTDQTEDCRTGEGCPPGYYCDLNDGTCKAGCVSSEDCGALSECDPATHTCTCVPDAHECASECVSNFEVSNCGSSCLPCPVPANGQATCDGASCGITCNSGFHACGNQCSSNTSPQSCGSSCAPCLAPANGQATCDGSSCGITCNSGFHACGELCLSNTSPQSCGSSCTPCPVPDNGQATCNGTACGFTCNSGYHSCGNQCVINTSTEHCGSSCNPCPVPDNGQATCDGSSCGVSCYLGYHACGSQCISDTSPEGCGSSCTPCPAPVNAHATCDGSSCGWLCNSGFSDCSGQCVDLMTDVDHCGGCTSTCGSGSTCFAGGCINSCSGTYAFAANPTTVSVGARPLFVLARDLDADGHVDLAVANSNKDTFSSGDVGILLGKGDGTFWPMVSYQVGTGGSSPCYDVNPSSIAAGDIDGDGKLDLVIGEIGSGSYGLELGCVTLLRGTGDGSFVNHTYHQIYGYPYTVAVGNFDGDTHDDVVICDCTQHNVIHVLYGSASGYLTSPQTLGPGSWPCRALALDLDGDGLDDVVTSNASPNFAGPTLPGTVGVLLGLGPVTEYTVGKSPSWIVSGDLDKDGLKDLAVVNNDYQSHSISVLLGAGSGTFGTQTTYATTDTSESLAAADLNGDGNLDLVTSQGWGSSDPDQVAIRYGTGNGTFGPSNTLAAGAVGYIAVADLDEDGWLDVAITDEYANSVVIHLGTCQP